MSDPRDLLSMGRFGIILADPPWRTEFGESCSRAVERHYATMLPEEIGRLHCPARDSALLFLWSTSPLLGWAMWLMAHWGFEYRTCAVWCKPKMGTGYWFRQQHELLLLGRRGDFPTPPAGQQMRSVIHAPVRRHSEKPPDVHDMIGRVWPDVRKLEMFARRRRRGWTTWGMETDKFEPLPVDAAT